MATEEEQSRTDDEKLFDRGKQSEAVFAGLGDRSLRALRKGVHRAKK